jgi:hypothetical protein
MTALAILVSASCIAQACKHEPPPGPSVSILWTTLPDTGKVVVEVQGLSPAALEQLRNAEWEPSRWQHLLAVYAGSEKSPLDYSMLPPTLGAYTVESNALRFTPQFAFEPEVKYQAIFQPNQLPGAEQSKESAVSSTFQTPPRDTASSTIVTHVYPSADVLPENLLKFYVHFSAPMSRGDIYEHIQLLDSQGHRVELPFLEINEELWDPEMMRLTLLLDPGRIKRGVRPLEDVGPALQTGKSYRLVIKGDWKDGNGNPLKSAFEKSFKVGPVDRITPNPKIWRVETPKAETLAPLLINFPEPMDNAVTQRVIQVFKEDGYIINGKVTMENEERRWVFVPEKPWRKGAYTLIIQTTIEDLAGNNIGKPFDVDTLEADRQQTPSTVTKLPFKID